jgi:hypothetical protein
MCIASVILQPVATAIVTKFGKTIDFDELYYKKRIDSIVGLVMHGIYKQDIRS